MAISIQPRWLLLVSSLCVISCAPPSSGDALEPTPSAVDSASPVHTRGPPSRVTRPLLPHPASDRFALAALGNAGEVVAFDARSGDVLASTPPLDAEGPIDIAYDAETPTLFAFEAVAGEEGGDLVRFSVAPGPISFGPATPSGWIDGIARFVSLHEGLLAFEENIGARWKLAPRDGGLTVSTSCPRPASIDLRPNEGGEADEGTDLVGISWPPIDTGKPSLLEMHVSTSGLGLCVKHELEQAPDSARTGVLDDGRVVLAGVDDGAVVLHSITADALGEASPLGFDAETVEAIVRVGPTSPHAAWILTTGPGRLAMVELGAGSSPGVIRRALVDLPFEAPREDRFFSRSIAVAGARAFVATTAGIRAFEVITDAGVTTLAPARFGGSDVAYRGPLVAIPLETPPRE